MDSSGIRTLEDLKTKELLVGGTGATADTVQFPKIANAVLGTKMKIIDDYPGGNDGVLAMERGEVTGRCGWSWSSVKSQGWTGSRTAPSTSSCSCRPRSIRTCRTCR